MIIPIYSSSVTGYRRLIKELDSCGPMGSGILSLFACNYYCPFCFAQKYTFQTEASLWIRPLAVIAPPVNWRMANGGACYLQFTGGEPMANEARLEEMVQALLAADAREAEEWWQRSSL